MSELEIAITQQQKSVQTS